MDKRLCELISLQEFITNTMIKWYGGGGWYSWQALLVNIFSQICIK